MKHEAQKEAWEKEHREPFALHQMDSPEVSGSVELFFEFLRSRNASMKKGIEMGCGKGRNSIWCAEQPEVDFMTGFDFSTAAIETARNRSRSAGTVEKARFLVHDATERWPFENESFDFGIDCTASTDIESLEGRAFAASEMVRVLKRGAFLLVYVMSTANEYHEEVRRQSPADEKGAFIHPATGKYEKVFEETEVDALYTLPLIEGKRLSKSTAFFGKEYKSEMLWRVYQRTA
jgi:ubiquinone/menaquinone biosynthesis C-methylase UbiE